jgi:CBS domain-containing protein
MRVQEIMTQAVSAGSPATNAASAAEIMWTNNCGSLPVVEDGGRVIGMVTDRDLFIALGTQNRRPAELTLGEVMRQETVACRPGDDVRQALKIMAKEKIRRLLVVDEAGILKGILSIDDVLARTDSVLKDDTMRTLKAISQNQTKSAKPEHLIVEASA